MAHIQELSPLHHAFQAHQEARPIFLYLQYGWNSKENQAYIHFSTKHVGLTSSPNPTNEYPFKVTASTESAAKFSYCIPSSPHACIEITESQTFTHQALQINGEIFIPRELENGGFRTDICVIVPAGQFVIMESNARHDWKRARTTAWAKISSGESGSKESERRYAKIEVVARHNYFQIKPEDLQVSHPRVRALKESSW